MKKIIFIFLILFLSIMNVTAEDNENNKGSLTINKYDIEKKERIKANLSSSIFGIYKNRRFIKEVKIGDSKTVTLKDLEFGEYMVKEIQSGTGYNIDTNEYIIIIDENNINFLLNSYSKVIEGNLKINKYYGDNNIYNIDEEAVFEIYSNNKLIKSINNLSDTKLEYGDYLIRQISGKKCYEFVNSFNISIQQEKDYQYDLYTEKIAEIKEYEELLNKKEESLKQKEEELKKWESSIEKTNNSLIILKQEIEVKNEKLVLLENELNKKDKTLNELRNELEKEKDELDKIKNNINKSYNEIEIKKQELNKKEEYLLKTKKEQNKNQEKINEQEEIIDKIKKDLELLKNRLNEKENYLIEKEKSINAKEIELEQEQEKLILLNKELNETKELLNKEEELIKLQSKQENVLVVEVPNTSKNNYNKIISMILIFIGSILIFCSNKKVTNYR